MRQNDRFTTTHWQGIMEKKERDMTKEVGTLEELDVHPGDVLVCVDAKSRSLTKGKEYKVNGSGGVQGDRGGEVLTTASLFRIASRASEQDDDTPKTWGEMTDAEKGALLLAHHEGKVIEWIDPTDTEDDWDEFCVNIGENHMAYRIKTKPIVMWLVVGGVPDFIYHYAKKEDAEKKAKEVGGRVAKMVEKMK